MKKKPEWPRRSVRKIDEHVINYACEDARVKFANVKPVTWEMFAGGGGGGEGREGGGTLPQEHPVCSSYCAGQVRGGDV